MSDQFSAWQLILNGDPALFAIVRLSLAVSLSAVALAALIGMPLGALLGLARFPGRSVPVVLPDGPPFAGLAPARRQRAFACPGDVNGVASRPLRAPAAPGS